MEKVRSRKVRTLAQGYTTKQWSIRHRTFSMEWQCSALSLNQAVFPVHSDSCTLLTALVFDLQECFRNKVKLLGQAMQ